MSSADCPSPRPSPVGRGGWWLLVVIALCACGYRFTAPNSTLPAGIRSVRVPVFVNRTSEPNADFFFADAARDQLQRAGTLGDDTADAVLEGTVLNVTSGAALASYEAGLGRQPVYRLFVTVSLTLKKNGVTVSNTTVSSNEEYPSGADVLLTESNRGAAVRRIAEASIREGFERLFSPQ